MNFINPPPFGTVGDFSRNPIYPEGSTLNIQWTEGNQGKPVSITLYQLNGTQWLDPFEYIVQNTVDVTSFRWIVATSKNLTFSNMFYMSVFENGKLTGDANSHYFNISSANTNVKPSSSPPSTKTSTSPTSTPPISSSSISTPASTPTNPPSSSQPPPPPTAASSNSFPTGAKIGIGVGIPVALILGIAAGFMLFRRRRKAEDKSGEVPAPVVAGPPGAAYSQHYGGAHQDGNYYDPVKPYHRSERSYGGGAAENVRTVRTVGPVEMESHEQAKYEMGKENNIMGPRGDGRHELPTG
ncbi:hypothetical protein GQ43DRAFT_474987 [Delitschia confertaspora ATCC 74209]|uniref:Mid2 domain-containing protein n=1 Tax=Delitschia confertaspora ATCC 74209 TaxID=1513339 RepID=A0A9P4JJQ3_9PLEO|nr:hypothetical protein GQ43DRAFT_474987 [Delitschia confertaspora ATCC 74209]